MIKTAIAAIAAALVMHSVAATALEVPSPLVTTEWLSANQDNVRVLDIRNDPESYKEGGHIIGAVRVDFKALRTTVSEDGVNIDDMSVRGSDFQALMQRSGVSADQPVVLTHRSRSPDDVGYAAYLYWQLKLHGHDNVAILDGGTSKWIAESREVWGEDETVDPGDFVAGNIRSQIVSDTKAVKTAVETKSANLVDSRLFEFYIGLEKRPAVLRAGHIPGAVSFPFNATLNFDGTFREKDKLAVAMQDAGVRPDHTVVAYCNTGHVAAISWFILHELLGYRNASLYDGSMLAWTKHGNGIQTVIPR